MVLTIDRLGLFIPLPGKLLGILIEQLQPKLAEAAHALLSDYHRAVQSTGGAAEEELAAGIAAVRQLGLSKASDA